KHGAECVRFTVGDIRDLPVASDSFDVAVTLGEPLSLMPDSAGMKSALDNVCRILKPGGLFILDLVAESFHRGLARKVRITERDSELILWRGIPTESDGEVIEVQMDRFTPAGATVWRRDSVRLSYRLFAPEEITRLLEQAGLHHEA